MITRWERLNGQKCKIDPLGPLYFSGIRKPSDKEHYVNLEAIFTLKLLIILMIWQITQAL